MQTLTNQHLRGSNDASNNQSQSQLCSQSHTTHSFHQCYLMYVYLFKDQRNILCNVRHVGDTTNVINIKKYVFGATTVFSLSILRSDFNVMIYQVMIVVMNPSTLLKSKPTYTINHTSLTL